MQEERKSDNISVYFVFVPPSSGSAQRKVIILIIYVFSDSHGSLTEMLGVVQESQPDMLLFLGDGLQDAEDLSSIFPEIPLYCVPGNCDNSHLPAIQLLEVEGERILFSHGHLWSVKGRMDIAMAAAKKEAATILLHGHTHIPKAEKVDGIWVMNPGTSPETYGIITLEQGTVHCEYRLSVKKR